MPDTIRCPDCCYENPGTRPAGGRCNFPLGDAAPGEAPRPEEEAAAGAPPASPAAPAPGAPPGAGGPPETPRWRIARPRRPRPASSAQLSFLLGVGAFV